MATPQDPPGEEIEEVEDKRQEEEEEKSRNKHTQPPPAPSFSTYPNPFTFWFYTTALVAFLAVLLSVFHSVLRPTTQHSWFLSFPPDLHRHYSGGVFVKTQPFSNGPLTQIFTVDHRPKEKATASETILLVHGLGCSSYSFRHVVKILAAGGFRAVAVDLPGSGFSDLVEEEGRKVDGVFGKVLRVYRDVKEKGLFWGFDHLVEMGYLPYDEVDKEEDEKRRRVADCLRSNDELGKILGQVVDSLELAPVHVVAHDSAMGAVAGFVSAKPGLVRSVTVVDSSSASSAFPSWVLGVPVVRELVLGSRRGLGGLLRLCCSRSIDDSTAEAYRVMLKRDGVRSAVVNAGKRVNYGFDLGEWAGSEQVKDVPLQVLWSHMTSDLWIQEGKRVAAAVPHARFVPHLGGRWPQEGAGEEIAGKIAEFVSSLPATRRWQVEAEHRCVERQCLLDEVNASTSSNHQPDSGDDHDHSHGHEYAAGYMDAYGLGQAWRS